MDWIQSKFRNDNVRNRKAKKRKAIIRGTLKMWTGLASEGNDDCGWKT